MNYLERSVSRIGMTAAVVCLLVESAFSAQCPDQTIGVTGSGATKRGATATAGFLAGDACTKACAKASPGGDNDTECVYAGTFTVNPSDKFKTEITPANSYPQGGDNPANKSIPKGSAHPC